jgi:hypothetical protein
MSRSIKTPKVGQLRQQSTPRTPPPPQQKSPLGRAASSTKSRSADRDVDDNDDEVVTNLRKSTKPSASEKHAQDVPLDANPRNAHDIPVLTTGQAMATASSISEATKRAGSVPIEKKKCCC